MKAGWALCKQTGQKCCNVQNWNSNPRGRGRGVGGGMWDTHQRCVNPMGLSEWKLPHWETCRLPTSRAKASQGTVCSLIHVQTSPGHPASQALCLKQRRVKKKKSGGGRKGKKTPWQWVLQFSRYRSTQWQTSPHLGLVSSYPPGIPVAKSTVSSVLKLFHIFAVFENVDDFMETFPPLLGFSFLLSWFLVTPS